MIKQMFKLIWNRKRNNFLVILGLFISFFVLFIAMVTVSYNLNNYLKPLGFDYENVWKIGLDWKLMERNEVKTKLRQIEFALQSFPEIESFAHSQSLLFFPAASVKNAYTYNEHEAECQNLSGGDQFPNVLGIEILEGRWFDESDNAANRRPIVINKYTKEELLPDENAVGKILTTGSNDDIEEFMVIGVIGEFRFGGEYTGSDNVVFNRISLDNDRYSRFANAPAGLYRIILRVKPGTPVEVEEKMLKQLSAAAKGMTITIDRLEESRRGANKTSLLLPVILAIICGFLITNVALGLLGMIWYHTNQRRSEIGLRRATGATAGQIYIQILGEAMVLTTFGIIIGSFVALQFPLLNLVSFIETNVYIFSYTLSVIIIYFITVVCALYPSKIAAQVQPAVALHYE